MNYSNNKYSVHYDRIVRYNLIRKLANNDKIDQKHLKR